MSSKVVIIFAVVYFIAITAGWDILPSKNVERFDCTARNGLKTCCSSLNGTHTKINNLRQRQLHHVKCSLTKKYIPSKYETRHIEKSKEITAIYNKNMMEGKTAFINFINMTEEVKAASSWLERVRLRMLNIHESETDDDFKYMSRFEIKKHCFDGHNETWNEWIEPISIHGRHPGAIYAEAIPELLHLFADLLQTDYILIQNNNNLKRRTTTHHASKSYIFDAGCSENFQISTQWFACAFSQTGIVADQVYSYEFEVSEPKAWWATVPTNWNSKVHFHNVPITNHETSDDNPLQVLKDVVHADDFVAFKLDVDTPSVEVPLAMQLLQDKYSKLVDEFFFELHFRCPVMAVRWGISPDPEQHDEFIMDSYHALTLFQSYREKGIRSHIWV